MNEGRDLGGRITEYQAKLPGGRSVIVPVGMICILDLSTHVAIEEVVEAPNRTVVDGRVRHRTFDADVRAARDRNRTVWG
jgi:hypothetical protein